MAYSSVRAATSTAILHISHKQITRVYEKQKEKSYRCIAEQWTSFSRRNRRTLTTSCVSFVSSQPKSALHNSLIQSCAGKRYLIDTPHANLETDAFAAVVRSVHRQTEKDCELRPLELRRLTDRECLIDAPGLNAIAAFALFLYLFLWLD